MVKLVNFASDLLFAWGRHLCPITFSLLVQMGEGLPPHNVVDKALSDEFVAAVVFLAEYMRYRCANKNSYDITRFCCRWRQTKRTRFCDQQPASNAELQIL